MKNFYSFLSTIRPDISLGIVLDWFFALPRTDQIEYIEKYAEGKPAKCSFCEDVIDSPLCNSCDLQLTMPTEEY